MGKGEIARNESFENTMGKGEIARNEQFPLFPLCFQKTQIQQTPKNKCLFVKGSNCNSNSEGKGSINLVSLKL